jgi:hypothetical protein
LRQPSAGKYAIFVPYQTTPAPKPAFRLPSLNIALAAAVPSLLAGCYPGNFRLRDTEGAKK